jgi:lantibiotic biosynthesis protein
MKSTPPHNFSENKTKQCMEFVADTYLKKINELTSTITYENDGFFGGKLGAVWYAYQQYRATEEPIYQEKTINLISEIYENLNQDNPKFLSGAAYSSSVSGFCYVVCQLTQAGVLETDLDEELADLEDFLYESAIEYIETQNLDFWHGAFGIVFYFLDRLNNPKIKAKTQILIEKILDQVIETENGSWFPNASLEKNRGVINLSLSHGQTSFLLILMQAYQKGILIEAIPQLVRKGVNLIQSYYEGSNIDIGKYTLFPLTINPITQERNSKNRLAFCYGDLNIAWLFYKAGDFLNDEKLKHKADLIGLSSLIRKDEKTTLVIDSHFCHGSAGVAQFYKTFYRHTGIEAYKKGYNYWIDRTLAFIDQDLQKGTFAGREGSLLEGWVGIALVLLDYKSKDVLTWGKMFLL